MNFEQLIFSNVLYNEDYARQCLPHIKAEYFHNQVDRKIFTLLDKYVADYNTIPTKEALLIEVSNTDGLSEEQFKVATDLIKTLDETQIKKDDKWLVDQTEKFCQDKAIYNAIMESIKIMDDKKSDKGKGNIPHLLTEALGVSFDNSIGHSFLEDSESRFDFYHRKEERIPFDLDYFNKITKGGLPKKTLNCFLAPTGVGKTLFMTHMAAANLLDSKNVLYITMEMAEERIAERIDANLMNVRIDELATMPKDTFMKKIDRLRQKTMGKLIIKEYPTSSAGSANFRHLLNELRLKKNFQPDIIYIDYLNICISSRLKSAVNVNSYTYVKTIAEELRGLAVEFEVPIVSATQANRSGFDNSDIDMTNTSESIGLPATVDSLFALIVTDELKELNQVMVKQLKNRYSDIEKHKRFVVGIDRSRMKLYDAEASAQDDIIDDGPVMDKTPVGTNDKKFDKSKFSGFK